MLYYSTNNAHLTVGNSSVRCSKTPQLERNWGGGRRREKERERERHSKVKRFSPFWRESDPVKNALNFYMYRESL
jgi:hypothetical protein